MKRAPLLLASAGYALRLLGPVGWAGIALVVAALLVTLLAAPRLRAQSQDEEWEIASLRVRLAQGRDPVRAAAARDTVEALLLSLPPSELAPEFVKDLERRAAIQGVRIDRSEYRVYPVLARSAQRYQVSFPAHATYPQLRIWIEGLLHDYPSLSLDELSLRREAEGGDGLETHVSFSLFLREGSSP